MDTSYIWFKYLHIVASIFWIGGVLTLTILDLRVAGEKDRAMLAALLRQSDFYGKAVFAPAGLVTLIAGVVMTILSSAEVALWIIWGLIGVFASTFLGAVLVRRVGGKLGELASVSPQHPRVNVLHRRLTLLHGVNLLLLLSVVWAMVFKPTL